MMISDLPGDLLEEILCRVPATSLKRLRSTCNGWNLLYNDGRFTRRHSDKAAKQFHVLDLKKFRVYSMSVNLHGTPSLEVVGKLSLNDSHSNSAQINISRVSSCDGLLLCTIKDETRIVVWNPCTGQTKWIQTKIVPTCKPWGWMTYTLGSYQDNKSHNYSYKVLRSVGLCDKEFEICDINSQSWRTIDAPDCSLSNPQSVSLKGKTYWFGSDGKEEHAFLVSFDYTKEIFERLSLDPCRFHNGSCPIVTLSVVKAEKISVLLHFPQTLRKEIWVTNKIDETITVSWIKVLTLDYHNYGFSTRCFLVDEEKKAVLMQCWRWNVSEAISKYIYIVGEVLTEVDLGAWSRLYNYVPSLIQIH